MARSGAEFAEGMQLGGPRRAEKTVPGLGAEAHDAGESAFGVANTDSAQKRGEVGAEGEDKIAIFVTGTDGEDEKDGGAS